jgi:alkylated DNA nucleotide flippase Atl1
MRVRQLFISPQAGLPIQECDHLQLEQGYGIQGDRHAQVGSHRQVLIVDQDTLKQFDLQPGDLQENILISTGLETLESGQVLQIGEARIRLTFLCEPCTYLETLQPGLAKRIRDRRGWLGMVITSGTIAVGDTITPTSNRFPPLANDAKSRFHELVARIPPGKVITTRDLVLALGVTRSHYRVFPRFIKKAPRSLPVHRIVTISGDLLSQHIPDQAQRLQEEGVEVRHNRVPETYYWSAADFHCCKIQSTASDKSFAM